jgi:hypothetical protein
MMAISVDDRVSKNTLTRRNAADLAAGKGRRGDAARNLAPSLLSWAVLAFLAPVVSGDHRRGYRIQLFSVYVN